MTMLVATSLGCSAEPTDDAEVTPREAAAIEPAAVPAELCADCSHDLVLDDVTRVDGLLTLRFRGKAPADPAGMKVFDHWVEAHEVAADAWVYEIVVPSDIEKRAAVYPTPVFATLAADQDVSLDFFLYTGNGEPEILTREENRDAIEAGEIAAVNTALLGDVLERAQEELGVPVVAGPHSIAPEPKPAVADPEDFE